MRERCGFTWGGEKGRQLQSLGVCLSHSCTFQEDGLCVRLLSLPLLAEWWLSAGRCRGTLERVWVQRQDKEKAVTPDWREIGLPWVFIWMDLQIGAGREGERAIRHQVIKHKEIIIKWAILCSASTNDDLQNYFTVNELDFQTHYAKKDTKRLFN